MLRDYKSAKENRMTLGDQRSKAVALTKAVHQIQRDNADKGRNTVLESAIGGQMQAMMALGSESSWLDGADDYVEVMEDDDAYLSMRQDIATLAAAQGLTPDQLTHEKVLELMDVAAQASERPEWIKKRRIKPLVVVEQLRRSGVLKLPNLKMPTLKTLLRQIRARPRGMKPIFTMLPLITTTIQ